MRKLLPVLATSSALLFGCNGSAPPVPTPDAPATTSAAPAPVDTAPAAASASAEAAPEGDASAPGAQDDTARANELAARLHRELVKTEKGNVFTSPTSLRLALGMLQVGAEGETAKQIASAASLAASPSEVATAAQAELGAWSKLASPAVELRIANRLWGEQAIQLEKPFLELTQRGWGAPLEKVDFKTAFEPARKTINAWIAKETASRIPELLPAGSLDSLTRLVLTNAVYFKGKWKVPFDKALTKNRDFSPGAGAKPKSVPFMHQTGSFAYAEESDLRLVSLPYGDTGAVSMVVVLPNDVGGLGAIEGRLSPATFEGWSKALATGSGRLELAFPKLELRWGGSVRKPLEGLGMTKAFTRQAELDGIQKGGQLQVSDVFHKTFVAVDEVGTEAAAATGIVVATRSMPAPPKPFVVDRPFLFYLRDTSTGRVLFLGRVVDPTAK